jgi:ubiquinol-cytochrome c reductase cytochrome b subunit
MAALPYEAEQNAADKELIETGFEAINDSLSCIDCHNFEERTFTSVADDDYYFEAPDLNGYMSREWLIASIRNIGALQFYGERNDRMPAFAQHDDPSLNQLTDDEIEIIVDWLRRDWSLDKSAD